MEYKDYEKACDKIRNTNDELLLIFRADLEKAGLSKKTIQNHIDNVDQYINDYLLREEPQTMDQGVTGLDSFFYFFIHKCMWSTPATVRSTAASFKKFYRCMMKNGKIEEADYEFLCEEIKESMPFWIEDCKNFNR